MTGIVRRSRFPAAVAALVLGACSQARTAEETTAGEQGFTAAGERNTARKVQLEEARIYFEFNQTDNDLGVHVFLDGEDWRQLAIVNPRERVIFAVSGSGGFGKLGMTELFFEGAEPSLDDVPLEELLRLFPEGEYEFSGRTIEGSEVKGEATFAHAVPSGPAVATEVGPNRLVRIHWTPVPGVPPGFPTREIVISGYQVIVGSFQVTLPASAMAVTLPQEFVASLGTGEHEFEVLAIEEGGNQTITASSFRL
jgi:hypothetical protein